MTSDSALLRRISRRTALQLGGAALVGAVVGCGRRGPSAAGPFGAEHADVWIGELSRDVPRPSDVPVADAFPLGVASGDVSDEGAVVWTRHDGPGRLLLAVFDDDDGAPGELVASVTPEVRAAGDEGCVVHVAVGGVEPGARYHYGFYVVGRRGAVSGRSPLGSFRAGRAPDDDRPLVVGASACTKAGQDLSLLERAAEREADVWVLLGDTVYADGARNLDEYRGAWRDGLRARGYRDLRRRVPVLATWDDHEVTNNFDPETIDPALLAAARRAFFEHQPLSRDPDDEQRIWRRRRFGAALEVFVLDTRGERRPSTRDTPDAEYISREQMTWLKRGLVESDAACKLIVNSVPIAEYPFPFESADRWQGYVAQRTELLSFVDDEEVSGVVWLSGDIHMGYVGRLANQGPGARLLEVTVGSTAQFTNPLAGLFGAPQFDFAAGENNTAELEVRPADGQLIVRFFGRGGRLFQRRYPLG